MNLLEFVIGSLFDRKRRLRAENGGEESLEGMAGNSKGHNKTYP
jgi:hypothetical protein